MSELSDQVAALFSARLSEARKKAGLSQEELGYRCGMSRAHIARLESGDHDVRLSSFMRLAGGLGIEPAELLPAGRWIPPAIASAGEFAPD